MDYSIFWANVYRPFLHIFCAKYGSECSAIYSRKSFVVDNPLPLKSITPNKASGGGDGIPAELFQILKDDAVKVLHSICQQIWKTQQWPQEKVRFHSNPKERQCQKMFKLL